MLEILTVKENLSYKIIRNISEEELAGKSKFLINDLLYGLEDALPEARDVQDLYFKLDDLAFLAPPSAQQLARLRNLMSRYDVVFWECFPPEKHWQMFADLFDFSDMLVIPVRYNKSSKLYVARTIGKLRGQRDKIFALLYDVKKSLGWKFRI